MLKYFYYEHLPAHLQEVSKRFYDLAVVLSAEKGVDVDEQRVALRKLLEAKDAAVRSHLV